jgi:hypothetical protein
MIIIQGLGGLSDEKILKFKNLESPPLKNKYISLVFFLYHVENDFNCVFT